MPGLSIHVVDVSRGKVASGMKVEIHGPDERLLVSGNTSARGALELEQRVAAGRYQARFYVADWYKAEGIPLPDVPFLDIVTFHFGIADPQQHYHLPFKCTPWGYSCFRGGA